MSARLLTLPEAAPLLNVSRGRIYELARQDALPGLRRLGKRSYRIAVSELEAFLGAPIDAPDQPEAA
jgi:excisionase family DNA binding protein